MNADIKLSRSPSLLLMDIKDPASVSTSFESKDVCGIEVVMIRGYCGI